MNLQAVADPDPNLLWVSGAIRGSVCDTAAARIWQFPRLLHVHGLFALADKVPLCSSSCQGDLGSVVCVTAHGAPEGADEAAFEAAERLSWWVLPSSRCFRWWLRPGLCRIRAWDNAM